MKKLLAIALLLCTVFSLSSFAPGVKPPHKSVKSAFAIPFPLTGITWGTVPGGPSGNVIGYSVNGSGDVPTSVTLYNETVSPHVAIGSWMFGPLTSGGYVAQGMKASTTITAFVLHVGSSFPNGYQLEIIGL